MPFGVQGLFCLHYAILYSKGGEFPMADKKTRKDAATAKGVGSKKGAQPKKTTLKRKDTRMKNFFGKGTVLAG